MADGKITFETALDNKNLAKQLKDVEREIAKNQKDITKSKEAKIPLVKQADELVVKLDNAKAKLFELQKEQAKIAATMANGKDPIAYMDAAARKKDNDAAVAKQQKETDALQKKWDGVVDKVDAYDVKIKEATEALESNQEKAGQMAKKLTGGGAKMREALDGAKDAAKRFEHRIFTLGKRILVFSMVANAFRSIKQYMSSLLQTNEQYQQELANIKASLMTAFQPIYEFILPALIAVLKVINAIVSVVANVVSILFGKSGKQSAKNAKALNKEAEALNGVGGAAKDAAKSLASFDEINKLDSPDAGGGGGAGGGAATPNFDQWDNSGFKQKIDELTAILSGSLLALGAILAFSGVNIPLGIALMAVGALGLAAVVKDNWNLIIDKIKGPLGKIIAIASASFIAIGAMIALSGVALPLGIALMAVGAAGLVAVTALNWNTVTEALQGPMGQMMAIISAGLLVVGIILAFSGGALPLGIALIAAGAAGLVTVTAINWNFLTEKVKEVWENIKSYWNTHIAPIFTKTWWREKFQCIGEGLKDKIKEGINSAIGLINSFTSWLNSVLSFNIPAFSIGNRQVFGGYSSSVNIPQIPYLAKGAVLPPNAPFMAMVGDQKRGTNVEAPLETIKQAVAEVLINNPQIDLMREGIELLRMILAKCGLYIDGKELASIVSRYQRQNARAFGG